MLQNMTSNINKYGGFYIAKHEASNNGSGKGQSKADVVPWVNINWTTSKAKAESMDSDWGWNTSVVESYLCYSSHWDTVIQWLIDSRAKTLAEINDSGTWGNCYDTTFTYGLGLTKTLNTSTLINTGITTNPLNRHMAKGMYDLAGNVWEWSMENFGTTQYVIRGGSYGNDGNYDTGCGPVGSRTFRAAEGTGASLGWRPVLYIH